MAAFRQKEILDRRHMGELVRGATLRLWNLQVARKDRIIDPSLFWTMPWDEVTHRSAADEVAELSEEERQDSLDRMKLLLGYGDGK